MAACPVLKGNVKLEGGYMKQFSHWSESCQCEMTFSIFLPERKKRMDADPPVLYYLSGLTCTDENARTKSHFAQEASRVGLAVVFPDTSPRGVNIEGNLKFIVNIWAESFLKLSLYFPSNDFF